MPLSSAISKMLASSRPFKKGAERLTKPTALRHLALYRGVPDKDMLPFDRDTAALIGRIGQSGLINVGKSKRDIAAQMLSIMSVIKRELASKTK